MKAVRDTQTLDIFEIPEAHVCTPGECGYNGSGYANEMLENPATGLLSRFGATVKHSLPYNSQARGVIERVHKTVWVTAAKMLPSYIGKDMDREARQKNYKLTRTGDGSGVVHLPISWSLFINACEDIVEAYNHKPHRSLPRFIDENGKRRRYSPAEYWKYKTESIEGFAAVTIDQEVAETLYRPRETRTVARGEISLFGNRYFAKALDVWHGEQVQVGYDVHDPQYVWAYDSDGRFICKVEFNGNAKGYFPKSVVEMAREERADNRKKRLDLAKEEADAERNGGMTLEAIPAEELPGMRAFVRKLDDEHPAETVSCLPREDRERYLLWRDLDQRAQAGEPPPEGLLPFYESFHKTAIWRSWNSFYNETTTGQERSQNN